MAKKIKTIIKFRLRQERQVRQKALDLLLDLME